MKDIKCKYCNKILGTINETIVDRELIKDYEKHIIHNHIDGICDDYYDFKKQIDYIYSKLSSGSLVSIRNEFYIVNEVEYVIKNEELMLLINVDDIRNEKLILQLSINNINDFGYNPNIISKKAFHKFYKIIKWYYSNDDNQIVEYDKQNKVMTFVTAVSWDIKNEYIKGDDFFELRKGIVEGHTIQQNKILYPIVSLNTVDDSWENLNVDYNYDFNSRYRYRIISSESPKINSVMWCKYKEQRPFIGKFIASESDGYVVRDLYSDDANIIVDTIKPLVNEIPFEIT